MKLRDKKTREIVEIKLIQTNCECLTEHEIDTYYGEPITLKLLNRMCEDYTPQEPLIRDKNIRKAVRNWAKINAIKRVDYNIYDSPSSYRFECNIDKDLIAIDFVGWLPELIKEDSYTIIELCGEEDNED